MIAFMFELDGNGSVTETVGRPLTLISLSELLTTVCDV